MSKFMVMVRFNVCLDIGYAHVFAELCQHLFLSSVSINTDLKARHLMVNTLQ